MICKVKNIVKAFMILVYVIENVSCIKVGMDQAKVTLVAANEVEKNGTRYPSLLLSLLSEFTMYTTSRECYKCMPQQVTYKQKPVLVKIGHNTSFTVDTNFEMDIDITEANRKSSMSNCSYPYRFYENWEYAIYVYYDAEMNTYKCHRPVIEYQAMDSNIPVYVALLLLTIIGLLWIIYINVARRYNCYRLLCVETERLVNSDLGAPTSDQNSETSMTTTPPPPQLPEGLRIPPAKPRLRSLDTFRGISIVLMIFVNYGGGGYWYFHHSAWNGLTVADLVFPWFIFIMGTSLAFSFKSQLKKSVAKWKILLSIIRRAITLFMLGLMLNTGPKHDDLSKLRIPGVLQRFALTYLVVASLYLMNARIDDPYRNKTIAPIRDIVYGWVEWLVQLILLAIYIVITFTLPVPGCPTGYIGPGGLAYNASDFNCTGGAAAYIDRQVFSSAHIYQHSTAMNVYHNTVPHDPEGLLGTLTSIFMCFLGLQSGKIILIYNTWKERVYRFTAWGIITGVIAMILCKCSKEEGWIPINKNLWSVSFILALASMAFILLMVCYIVIDVYSWWSGAPFYFAGMNAILLYIGHEVMEKGYFPIHFHADDNHVEQLAMDIWGATFWTIVAYVLHKKKLYFSV